MSVDVVLHVPSTAPAELIDYLDGQTKILNAESGGRYAVEVVVDATCRGCGCTDDVACLGGCWWIEENEDGYLCSSCAS